MKTSFAPLLSPAAEQWSKGLVPLSVSPSVGESSKGMSDMETVAEKQGNVDESSEIYEKM